MIVGIVGLGLIGGSFAKAYRAAGHRVLGCDTDKTVLDQAMLSGAVDEPLSDANISECDLLLITTYIFAAEEWFETHASRISPHTLVIDCLGVKRHICRKGFALAKKYGFSYLGGHPMAGAQFSGFKYARATLFKGAPMVLVPPGYDDTELLARAKQMLAPAGFGMYSIATAEAHDRTIAFTSQMPHIISNAFIKSPTARNHLGFSAGSYKDMTRVAWLNPQMWAELFMDNKDNVLPEIDWLIGFLNEYKDALINDDMEELLKLLGEGSRLKHEIDG